MSQETVASSRTASPVRQDESGLCSPILPILPQQNPTKPRKAPTITPRSFTRFFTPKSSFEHGGRAGASKRILRDITVSGANRKGRRTPINDSIIIKTCSNLRGVSNAKKRKRYKPPSPASTPDLSSPLKRIRNQSFHILEDNDNGEESFESEVEENEAAHSDHLHCTYTGHVGGITHSRYRNELGRRLQQEVGDNSIGKWNLLMGNGSTGSNEYKNETANFYTKPGDAHSCYNISTPAEHTIPFCAASCNSEHSHVQGFLEIDI